MNKKVTLATYFDTMTYQNLNRGKRMPPKRKGLFARLKKFFAVENITPLVPVPKVKLSSAAVSRILLAKNAHRAQLKTARDVGALIIILSSLAAVFYGYMKIESESEHHNAHIALENEYNFHQCNPGTLSQSEIKKHNDYVTAHNFLYLNNPRYSCSGCKMIGE